MNWKKIGRALLFPHIIIMIILIPISVVFLVYSMIALGTESIVAIISYVLAAYTLTVWCVKIPLFIRFFREFKNSNKYVVLWSSDTRLRTNITLVGTLSGTAHMQFFTLFWE